jgi:hypothetical protein
MKELNHNTLRYSGESGEDVTIRVTAEGTKQLVVYKLDQSPAKPLKEGEAITFKIKDNEGDRTNLQLTLDFTALGSYEVTVENVDNCKKDDEGANECVHVWKGPPLSIKHFSFFVQ